MELYAGATWELAPPGAKVSRSQEGDEVLVLPLRFSLGSDDVGLIPGLNSRHSGGLPMHDLA
jgi:hypothetical protein